MSNSVYHQSFLSYVAETVHGETPATPSMLKLRTTNPLGLSPTKALLESEEVFAHRQRENVRHGLKGVGGNIPIELSYEAFDDWLEALLSGAWSTGVLKVGSTLKTFTVEQAISGSIFNRFLGVSPSQLSLTMNPTGLVSGTFEVVGMDFGTAATSLGSPADVATHAPFDGLGNASIEEGGSAIAIVTSVEMSINSQKTVGALIGKASGDVPTDGQLQITGTLTARFNDLDLFNKFSDETDSSLKIGFTNPGGAQVLEFHLPRLKYNSGEPQNNDNVIDVALAFEGLYHAGEASSIVITKS